MKDVTEKNFGVIIAFLVPGFLLLWGLSYSSPEIDGWLAKSNAANAPTIGGFLYATLTSLALGLLISAFRYLIIDGFLHRVTGLNPEFDFTKLKDKDALAMFQAAVENHLLHPDAWDRFRSAVHVMTKAGPQHREPKPKLAKQKPRPNKTKKR